MFKDFPEERSMRNLYTAYRRLSDMKLNTDKQLLTYLQKAEKSIW